VEIHPGVFVSSTATEDWRPDPEVGGALHVLLEDETAYAGMSRFGDVANPEPWSLPERETLLILEGAARIEIEDGPTITLQVGDLASLPKGAVTTWQSRQGLCAPGDRHSAVRIGGRTPTCGLVPCRHHRPESRSGRLAGPGGAYSTRSGDSSASGPQVRSRDTLTGQTSPGAARFGCP
jgi:uncharacterized cupin superfamily protein